MNKSKRGQLRIRLKRALVSAGAAGIASRRVIRAVIVALGLEHA